MGGMDGTPGDPLSWRPHPAIEKWAKYKEDYHLRFKFTGRRTLDIAFWGIAIPVGLYFLIKNEQARVDKQSGRPNSKFL